MRLNPFRAVLLCIIWCHHNIEANQLYATEELTTCFDGTLLTIGTDSIAPNS